MTENDTPVANRRIKRATVRKLLIFGGGALGVVVLATVAYIVATKFLSGRAEDQREALNATAKSSAEQIGSYITGAALKLSIVADRAEVIDALRAKDAQALKSLAGASGAGVEGLMKLRLVRVDVKTPDESGSPPFSYSALEMVARARQSEGKAPTEIHLFGSPDEHIAVLRPINSETGELLGFVHGAFDPKILREQVTALAGDGWMQITQPVPRAPASVLASTAGSRPEDASAVVSAPVPGTSWTLSYAGEPGAQQLADAQSDTGSFLTPILSALVLMLAAAAGFVFLQRRKADLVGETVIYQGAVKAIMDGAHPGLERLVPGIKPATDAAPADAAVRDELDGDDITTFTPTGSDAPSKPAPPSPEPEMTVEETEADKAEIDAMFAIDGSDADDVEPEEDLESTPEQPVSETPAAPVEEGKVPSVIFRAYDIRGIVGESLTVDTVRLIGLALGSEAFERGQQGIVVARDGRLSSPEFAEALIGGLVESGRDVIDIGCVPTPVLYFATHYLDTGSGVMITGSHNPGNYNGFKIVLDGQTLSGEAIEAIRTRIEAEDFTSGSGNVQSADMISEYIRRVSEDIPVSLGDALKIVVDCGNGVPGVVAPALLRALGHDVVELYCEVDGNFPNHHPDPGQPENLQDLIDLVSLENADIGFAFDGDGDRLGVVDAEGNIIWPDRQMILFAQDVLSRNAGAEIIYDVKCSRRLPEAVEAAGGKATMCRTGHSMIKSKMQETGALLAGEMSGHIFFKERWYGFDDAMYSAARLVEILVAADVSPVELFAAIPDGVATPELKIDLPESQHQQVMEALLAAASFDGAQVSTIDGLRVDFPDSWGLIRPSNTTPCLVMRFEGDDDAALASVQDQFKALISSAAPTLKLPF